MLLSLASALPAPLKHLYGVGATLVVLGLLTYALPDDWGKNVTALKPWVEGDAPLYAGFRGIDTRQADKDTGLSEELLAEAGAHPAEAEDADLVAPPPVVAKAPPKAPTAAPKRPAAAPAPRPDAPPTPPVAVKPTDDAPAVALDPAEWKGISGELEDPSGKALDTFFRALHRTARREPGAITRISHWGASVIAADGFTSVARRKLQALFGSGGKGWVNVAPGSKWYRQRDVVYKPRGWKDRMVTFDSLKSGRYGFGGVAAIGAPGAVSSYQAHATRLELYYLAQPKGGEVELAVEDGPTQVVSTALPDGAAQDAWATLVAPALDPQKPNTFTVKALGKGPVHLYGVTLETDGPGVVYDCLGLIGTRADRLLHFDETHIAAQVAHRKPDLIVLDFGGNETGDENMNLRLYEESYKDVIRRMRKGRPEASCLVLTPVDHAENDRGKLVTKPILRRMLPVMRRLAKDEGCAVFDVWKAMGGEGSLRKWVTNDFAYADSHLTAGGDRVLGAMLYKAIVKGYSDWRSKASR